MQKLCSAYVYEISVKEVLLILGDSHKERDRKEGPTQDYEGKIIEIGSERFIIVGTQYNRGVF